MNFFLTKQKDYNNPLHLQIKHFGEFSLYHDDCWKVEDAKISKGISSNFCEIEICEGGQIYIRHNSQRDFPLWFDNNQCTNIHKLANYLPTDAIITYDKNWHVSYDDRWKTSDTFELSRSKAIDLIKSVLTDNVSKFAESNNLPLLAPDSDGLDTLLMRSVFDYLQIDYKTFTLQNRRTKLQEYLGEKYYGFVQVQDFDEPCCLLSGFYGDEYLLRSPSQTQMLIEDDIVDLFDATQTSYMKDFFNQIYREKCKKIKKTSKTQVKEIIYNDIQVWHSDRTFVFSPFKDSRLLSLLDCDQDVMIAQQIHGDISKELIEYFNPQLLSNLSAQKNSTEPHWFGP